MKKITVRKGEILQSLGDVNSYIYKIQKGVLRMYSMGTNGKEHILLFGSEGWTIGESNLPKTPCEFYIDALEESELLVSNKDDSENDPTKEFFLHCIGMLQKRVIMLMSVSAKDRYEDFIKTYPKIAQRIPQKMIASYLGITPEALSKIKRS
ncbi:Crp/Fnr family transcriptional regulator [Croceitalea rosinachiae]|uniref:Crp/Fnr family transcriptional regulator n=1 Tax=Croceitalea rosinachiae TaxID=3075596 RepID=A0ABU3AC18_9FLAO|nr:Crp/Fnr family transcriptional regulator [Croceitalea sp. F388]MDT0607718.1 Crp/Fnr family transcriptional regulator [Croceitalea sp. F388]